MDSREIDAYHFLMTVYDGIMRGKLRTKIKDANLRDYQLTQQAVPEEVILDTTRITAIIWVGDFPTPNNVPPDIGDFLLS